MSDRSRRRGRPAMDLFAAVILGLFVGAAAPAFACTAVSPRVVLCTEGTELAPLRAERFDDVVTWTGEGLWIEFNPLLSEAVAAGPAADALDQLVAMLLDEDGAPAVETVLRDRFETDIATVERIVMRIEEEGESYLGGLMLAGFADATPRLAWSMAGFDPMTLEDLLGVIEATAAGLRPGSEP